MTPALMLVGIETIHAQEVVDPSFFSTDPLWLEDSPIDPNCQVDIVGDNPTMYPGNFTSLRALVRGGVTPEGFAWAIEPDIVKNYDDRVFEGNLLSSVDPVTPMAPSDFQKPRVSFYWKSEADTNRTVGVRVLTEDGICQDVENYTVRIGNTTNTQPEDFYVVSNDRIGSNSTRVLQEHNAWHRQYMHNAPSYNDKGDLFFQFHKLYLAHFDAFRNEFGYPPIQIWDPGTALPSGLSVDHASRAGSYSSASLPTWFIAQPSGNGPTERQPDFLRSCEQVDASSLSWPDRTQDSLNDFEPDKELLGCVLTSPYHNLRHGAIGGFDGDMSFTDRAPIDPMFWRLHKFINEVSEARDGLTLFGTIGNTTLPPTEANRSDLTPNVSIPEVNRRDLTPISFQTEDNRNDLAFAQPADELTRITINDTSPPHVESRDPQTVLPFVTDVLGEVSVTFNEAVKNVLPGDLVVNESPATGVEGNGLGPYIFMGFNQPSQGTVNVSLLPGSITDLNNNLFKGDSWNYSLVQSNSDGDKDGILDGLEIDEFLTDPTSPDTDLDTIPDGFEVDVRCLNPLVDDSKVVNFMGDVVNSTGRDFDNDGSTNVEEFNEGTSPCS